MKILDVRPPPTRRRDGLFQDVCYFDAQVTDGLRLKGLRLAVARDGRRMVFAPAKNGRILATFSADFANQIIEAVSAAIRSFETIDRHQH